MKKIIIPILIISILGIGLVFYYNKNSKLSSENNSNVNKDGGIEKTQPTFVNDIEGAKEFKKIVIPGLRIMGIDSDSPLNKVTLVALNDSYKLGSDSLLIGDIITGISTNYDKTNFDDIINRNRLSKYFIPVNSEQELYSEINKLKTNKIMLGIVRKVQAGTGYVYRPDIAVFSVEKLEGNYLKTTLLLNSEELYK